MLAEALERLPHKQRGRQFQAGPPRQKPAPLAVDNCNIATLSFSAMAKVAAGNDRSMSAFPMCWPPCDNDAERLPEKAMSDIVKNMSSQSAVPTFTLAPTSFGFVESTKAAPTTCTETQQSSPVAPADHAPQSCKSHTHMRRMRSASRVCGPRLLARSDTAPATNLASRGHVKLNSLTPRDAHQGSPAALGENPLQPSFAQYKSPRDAAVVRVLSPQCLRTDSASVPSSVQLTSPRPSTRILEETQQQSPSAPCPMQRGSPQCSSPRGVRQSPVPTSPAVTCSDTALATNSIQLSSPRLQTPRPHDVPLSARVGSTMHSNGTQRFNGPPPRFTAVASVGCSCHSQSSISQCMSAQNSANSRRFAPPPPASSEGFVRFQPVVPDWARPRCQVASPTAESEGSTCIASPEDSRASCSTSLASWNCPSEGPMLARSTGTLQNTGSKYVAATNASATSDERLESIKLAEYACSIGDASSEVLDDIADVFNSEFQYASLESLGYVVTEDIVEVRHGIIQLAAHEATNELRCVKCYDKAGMPLESLELLKAEADFMFTLGKHPNIGEAIEIFQDADFYFLSMPYYSGGTLVDLKGRAADAGVVPTENWWTGIFRQCLEGLAYMHGQDVMHCDIKEPNIMICTEDLHNPEIVIIDLGVAQRASTQRSVIYGTPGYIPPEVWEGKNWYPQSDLFSLGVVVVQTLIRKCGVFTENTRTYREMKEATLKRTPPFELMPAEFPSLQGLARTLLQKDFRSRATAAAMLDDTWKAGSEIDSKAMRNRRRHTCPDMGGCLTDKIAADDC